MGGLYLASEARLARTSGILNLASAFTVSLWVKPPDDDGAEDNTILSWQEVADYLGVAGDTYLWLGWTYISDPREKLRRATVSLQNGEDDAPYVARVVDRSSWVHIGVISDASTLTFYVGLCEVGSIALQSFTPAVVQMGAVATDWNSDGLKDLSLFGSVRQLRMWQRALSAAELEAEAQSATVVSSSSLFANYPFATGSDLNDASGNGRHWTLTQGSASTASGDPDYAPAGCVPFIDPGGGYDPSAPCCDTGTGGGVGAGTSGHILPAVSPDWTPSCTDSGVVPTQTALTDAENWSTLTGTPCVRVTLALAKYPATEGTTTYRWSSRPLADTGAFAEGRIIRLGDITRSCADQDGNYEIARVQIELSDDDGLFRSMVADANAQYSYGREVAIELLSEAGRAAGTAWSTRFRGVVTDISLSGGQGRTATIQVSDLVGSKFSSFDLEREIGVPIGDEHTNLPDESLGRIYPIIVGEHSDLDAVDVNGESAEKGLLPVIDTGDYHIDGSSDPVVSLSAPANLTLEIVGTPGSRRVVYAVSTGNGVGESRKSADVAILNAPDTLDLSNYVKITYDAVVGATFYRIWGRDSTNTWLDGMNNGGTYVSPETEYHDNGDDIPKSGPDLSTGTAVEDGVWGRLLVSIGYTDVHDVFWSDLNEGGTPKRVKAQAHLDGVEFMTSSSADWPHADPYIEVGGIRQTVIYVRGPRLKAHRDGSVTIAVTGCGMEDVGDGTGVLVGQAFRAGQLFLNEHILKDGGTGYRTGDYGPLEAFANGDAQVATARWEAAQTKTAGWIGGTGYKGAWAIYEPLTVREWVRRFCLTFDCRLAVSHHGQIYPVLVDPTASASTGQRFREFVEGVELVDQRFAIDEVENRIVYSFDYDNDAQAYRATEQTLEDDESIAAHVPGGVSGGANPRGVFQRSAYELWATRDADTAADAMGRRLARNRRAPRYVTCGQDLLGAANELGDQIRFTHQHGIGPTGDVDTPLCVLSHTLTFAPFGTVLVGFDLARANEAFAA